MATLRQRNKKWQVQVRISNYGAISKTFKKITPYKYEELGLKFFERSAEYKKKVEAWRPIQFEKMPKF